MIHRTSHFPFMGFQSQIHCIPISSRKQCFLYWWGAVAATLDTKRKIIFMLWGNLFRAFVINWDCRGCCSEEQMSKAECYQVLYLEKFCYEPLFVARTADASPQLFPLCPVNSIFYAPTPPSENNMASLDDNN